MYKIGPNKFMGGGGVCGRGEKGGAFCSVCIFHNQKMHVYLIFYLNATRKDESKFLKNVFILNLARIREKKFLVFSSVWAITAIICTYVTKPVCSVFPFSRRNSDTKHDINFNGKVKEEKAVKKECRLK